MTNDRKKDLFSADLPLASDFVSDGTFVVALVREDVASELSESGINQTAGGKSVAYSGCNAGWVCTATKECMRICRWR